jgi:hypothetical protein
MENSYPRLLSYSRRLERTMELSIDCDHEDLIQITALLLLTASGFSYIENQEHFLGVFLTTMRRQAIDACRPAG